MMTVRVISLLLLSASFIGTSAAQKLPSVTSNSLPSITGKKVACVSGWADEHRCGSVDMMARLSMDDLYTTTGPNDTGIDGGLLNDIWGWTDPLSGREYALVGRNDAVAFVDVTNPIEPVYVGHLPSHDGAGSVWRDMKVYMDHMFVVVDAVGENGMQVFDLTELRRFTGNPIQFNQSARYPGVRQAHNLAINEESGFAYIVGGRPGCPGLHMVDIRSPLEPYYAGCFIHADPNYQTDGYTHDTQCVNYRGPHTPYHGRELCFSSNEAALSVVDVTDKDNPVIVASASYPDVSYTHQGWLTEDHKYFVMNDEGDEWAMWNQDGKTRTRTLIWDVIEVDDPMLIAEHYGDAGAIDHNLYIRKNYVFASNYTHGLRIIDIQDPYSPREVAYFDTHPESDNLAFDGTWSNYPFFASGTVVVNSHPDGLLVLSPNGLDLSSVSTASDGEIPSTLTLANAYPNPFNPSTTISVSIPEATDISVDVFDLLGRPVANLLRGPVRAGTRLLTFEGDALPSGTYIIRAQAGQHTVSQHVTLLK